MKKGFKSILLLGSSYFTYFLYAGGELIEKLTAPNLYGEVTEEYITCTRPRRDGLCTISCENYENKKVFHCYGHGGWGWSTLYGSVQAIKGLLQDHHVERNIPIQIIGQDVWA